MEQNQNETIDFTDKEPSTETDTDINENTADDQVSPEENLSNGNKPRFHLNLHLFLIAAILIIAAVSVYRLNRWNKGTKLSDDTEDVDTSQFDIEVLDMILPMDSSSWKDMKMTV